MTVLLLQRGMCGEIVPGSCLCEVGGDMAILTDRRLDGVLLSRLNLGSVQCTLEYRYKLRIFFGLRSQNK
jgi:hypothetical protein